MYTAVKLFVSRQHGSGSLILLIAYVLHPVDVPAVVDSQLRCRMPETSRTFAEACGRLARTQKQSKSLDQLLAVRAIELLSRTCRTTSA